MEISLGLKEPKKLLGVDNFTTGALFNWNGLELAGVFMRIIDITGYERLAHNELLRQSGCDVSPTIFATTNFCASLYIPGEIPNDRTSSKYISKLDIIREKLIKRNMWDPTIRIDASPTDFRVNKVKRKNKVTAIDPTFRHCKFSF